MTTDFYLLLDTVFLIRFLKGLGKLVKLEVEKLCQLKFSIFQQEDRIVRAKLREYEERQMKNEFSIAVSD